MDDFTPYGYASKEGMKNLEKLLKWFKYTHVSLGTIKFHMMMEEEIVLGHLLSAARIRVDPAKVEVILIFPTPMMVCRFIGYLGYYIHFIEKKKNQDNISTFLIIT